MRGSDSARPPRSTALVDSLRQLFVVGMELFWRALRKAAPAGLASGTLYFIVIGALTFFTSVLVNQRVTLLWFVLFIGAGAGLGLLFGVICAASLSLFLPRNARDSPTARRWARIVGGLACGVPVFAVTMMEQLTGWVGVLAPEFTTVVVIPTAVAALAGAAAAPDLLNLPRPGDPRPS